MVEQPTQCFEKCGVGSVILHATLLLQNSHEVIQVTDASVYIVSGPRGVPAVSSQPMAQAYVGPSSLAIDWRLSCSRTCFTI